MLTRGTKDRGHGNRCYRLTSGSDLDLTGTMKDTWSSVYEDDPGLTFSNMVNLDVKYLIGNLHMQHVSRSGNC